ncbi:HTH 24 domain containing protein, partial [Asbolus verrucosus]
MENEPRTSIRRLAQQMDLSVGTCHAILRKDMHIYPYKITSVQELLPVDPPRRLEFCNWFLNGLNNDDMLIIITLKVFLRMKHGFTELGML